MKYVLVIYIDDNTLHDLIGPFDNDESAYLHVDKIRDELNSSDLCWSFSVWPLTQIVSEANHV